MGEFVRDRLPDPAGYFESEGLKLTGRGKWRTTRCDFHDGSDSMRINVESGGWICMSCGTKGGDVLAYQMQQHGQDFVTAAKALGAYVDDGKAYQWQDRPRRFSARDALDVVGVELLICVVVIADARKGITPNDNDWHRFLEAAGLVEAIAREATT